MVTWKILIWISVEFLESLQTGHFDYGSDSEYFVLLAANSIFLLKLLIDLLIIRNHGVPIENAQKGKKP